MSDATPVPIPHLKAPLDQETVHSLTDVHLATLVLIALQKGTVIYEAEHQGCHKFMITRGDDMLSVGLWVDCKSDVPNLQVKVAGSRYRLFNSDEQKDTRRAWAKKLYDEAIVGLNRNRYNAILALIGPSEPDE